MSELDMITVIFVINIAHIIISSWHMSSIGYEVHKILEQVKEDKDANRNSND